LISVSSNNFLLKTKIFVYIAIVQIKELLLKCEDLAKRDLKEKELHIVLKVITTLTILQNQYLMIEELYYLRMSCESNNKDVTDIVEKYASLLQFHIKIETMDEFCLPMILKIVPFFLEILKKFKNKLRKLVENWNLNKKAFYFNFLFIFVKNITEFLIFL